MHDQNAYTPILKYKFKVQSEVEWGLRGWETNKDPLFNERHMNHPKSMTISGQYSSMIRGASFQC